MAKRLAKELGLGVGISSGANFIGSVLQNDISNKPSTTVFADDNKKYLSTDLFKEIEIKKEYISTKVHLLNYEVV